MPGLSLIVPFQRDSDALEATLLSILESRGSDLELIISHRGEYDDPYGLGGDEVSIVENGANASMAEQLNRAARIATGNVIQVVLPGSVLEADWAEAALDAFDETDVDLIALGITPSEGGEPIYGFEESVLPQRKLSTIPSKTAFPVLGGTMIRRTVLLSLGGWNEQVPADLIDLELGLLAKATGIEVGVVDEPGLTREENLSVVLSNYEFGRAIGKLACAYSEAPNSGVVVEPLVKRLGHLACGLMNTKLAAERLGWVLGVQDRAWSKGIATRIASARRSLVECRRQAPEHSGLIVGTEQRRAA